ncbi:MAG TPA: SIR2 family protein [Pyrinomonadaceae bacterium]|nr:SIR2 family protein [Pyrinomonadaceae bacterium]
MEQRQAMVLPADQAAIAEIAEKVSKGECILFLGAGVHYPPPEGSIYSYPEEQRLPLGRAFSQALADKSGFSEQFPKDSTGNLQRVALYYETKLGRNNLVNEIKNAVMYGKKPSPVVRALARLNFPLVITTNYDQLFEDALRMPKPLGPEKRPFVSVYNKDGSDPTKEYPGDPAADQPFVVKIHGDVQSPESMVITDEDYIQFVLRMSDKIPYNPIPLTFSYFFTRRPTLFVGYSLMDYNLRLLFKTLRWKIDPSNIPDTYSVDLYPDPLILDVWYNQRRYVRFIAQDVWTFVPNLYRMITGEEMPQ